ncbi:MAG: radical SAM protein [Deltaproteobacteria bacterium]|nr:radical SAM protein [Deltaproteobacteria bacterium]
MRVLLVSSNTERLNMPTMPVGLALVAEATRKGGHEVLFLDLMHEADPAEALRRAVAAHAPQVIGVSVRNIDDQSMQGPRLLVAQVRPIIEACRAASRAPIVLGGTGFSLFPGPLLDYLGADYGVCGDGEVVFGALLDRLGRSEDPFGLPGVHAVGRSGPAEASFAAELDPLPLPEPELWSYLDPDTPDLWVPVQSRRGCPNDCSYCATFRIQGRRLRSRSPGLVAESVGRMVQAGFRRFYFVDNSFNIPEPHAFELCRRLAGLGAQWRCILYPERVDEGLVRAMKEAGCVEVALGFESGSAGVLRAMNKRYTPAQVRATADLLARFGIRRMGFLLLGMPGETRETVEESLAFADSLHLDMLRITVGVRIYPGTPLARIALEQGAIDPGDDLFLPRFYVAPGLEPWIHKRVQVGVTAKR